MFYTARKMFNGRKVFSCAAAYTYLLKHVAHFFLAHVFNNTFSSNI